MKRDLTKNEKSLLLFFEAAAVDDGGPLNINHMNDDDMDIAERWNAEGFVSFGRVCIKDVRFFRGKTHYVFLSDEAWYLAHAERKARFESLNSVRGWQTATEWGESYKGPI